MGEWVKGKAGLKEKNISALKMLKLLCLTKPAIAKLETTKNELDNDVWPRGDGKKDNEMDRHDWRERDKKE